MVVIRQWLLLLLLLLLSTYLFSHSLHNNSFRPPRGINPVCLVFLLPLPLPSTPCSFLGHRWTVSLSASTGPHPTNTLISFSFLPLPHFSFSLPFLSPSYNPLTWIVLFNPSSSSCLSPRFTLVPCTTRAVTPPLRWTLSPRPACTVPSFPLVLPLVRGFW